MIYNKLKECHEKQIDKWLSHIAEEEISEYEGGERKDKIQIWDETLDLASVRIEEDGLINYIEVLDEDADDVEECNYFTIDNEAIAYIETLRTFSMAEAFLGEISYVRF